jgi:hypothetical protein
MNLPSDQGYGQATMPTMHSRRCALRSHLDRDEDGRAIGNGPEAGDVTSSGGNNRLVTSNPLVIGVARI